MNLDSLKHPRWELITSLNGNLRCHLESSMTFLSKEQRLTTVYPRIHIIKHIMIYKYISYEWQKRKRKEPKEKEIYIK